MKQWQVYLAIIVFVVWLFREPIMMLARSIIGLKTKPSDLSDLDNPLKWK
jgi:hypothetical protein